MCLESQVSIYIHFVSLRCPSHTVSSFSLPLSPSFSLLSPLQVDNIRRNVEAFSDELAKFRTTFRKDAPFDWREGLEGADSAYQVCVCELIREPSVWSSTSVV
jgi:hypothetical protein